MEKETRQPVDQCGTGGDAAPSGEGIWPASPLGATSSEVLSAIRPERVAALGHTAHRPAAADSEGVGPMPPSVPEIEDLPSSDYLAALRSSMSRRSNPFREWVKRDRLQRRRLKSRLGKKEFARRRRQGQLLALGLER